MIKVGIIGGAGYTAGELTRILLNHPEVKIEWIHSNSQAGLPITQVHGGLIGETDLTFSDTTDLNAVDVVFLCMGHGKSAEFWAANPRPEKLVVIDLAQDYRDESCGYVYALPEFQRERIAGSKLIANPGCFATAIQMALLPLAKAGLLKQDINVTAITGSTGAGVKPGATTHFSWRNDNLSVYKAFTHQHLHEIRRTLTTLQGSEVAPILFVPMRGDFARGIFASVYTRCELSEEEAVKLYKDFYADAKFTHVSDRALDLKQVTNTNKALLHVEKHDDQLLITSCIDNLLKGASGQAVQNMNIAMGLPEDMGLRLKPNAC
ncbi:MAG: N-acetyl-gamma-glutamyl-phosphate reductase [Bacteroidales bacterium]|nr:N-acetyl-gamma-glutamyl-phosphate reductase [Candidatus Sodaliphilus fimicaballi]